MLCQMSRECSTSLTLHTCTYALLQSFRYTTGLFLLEEFGPFYCGKSHATEHKHALSNVNPWTLALAEHTLKENHYIDLDKAEVLESNCDLFYQHCAMEA